MRIFFQLLLRHAAPLLALAAGCAPAGAGWFEESARWFSPELRALDGGERALRQALLKLPPAPELQLTGRLGHHSQVRKFAESIEWVEMDLQTEEVVDAVVLIAAPSASGGPASAGYGFPVRFRVELRTDPAETEGEIIADHTGADFPNPGALPVHLPAAGRRARLVRVTATRLYGGGGRHFLALGEMMILQGRRNLAAHLARTDIKVTSSRGAIPVWGIANLVDGQSVIGPPVGTQRSPSLGYQSLPFEVPRDGAPAPVPRWVQVDLGRVVLVDEVRLFPAHPPEFAHRPGYGYPPGHQVELAATADMREAIRLPGFLVGVGFDALAQQDPTMPGDNVVTFPASSLPARHVRVTALRPFNANGRYNFALAEMQVWSGDANVALGRPVSAFDSEETNGWSRAALVDGFNSQANILDWPEWLTGLSARRETLQQLVTLEARRSQVLNRLKHAHWWLLAAGAAVSVLFVGGFMLKQRLDRRLELEALRQRISQDLHDEVGSSLGSIAFISEDALAIARDDDLRRELAEIRDTAQHTLDSMRDIVRLAQSGLYGQGDLTAQLREIAGRMLRGVPHTISLEAAAAFNRVPMRQRRDLVLMFKEALHNLVRHAQAKRADIALTQRGGALTLTVRDDGRGFDPAALSGAGMGLANLQRRAARHGGGVRITSAPARGTTVEITLPGHA